jgi:hypothetical protein
MYNITITYSTQFDSPLKLLQDESFALDTHHHPQRWRLVMLKSMKGLARLKAVKKTSRS